MDYAIKTKEVLRQAINKAQIYGNAIDWVKSLLLPAEHLNTRFLTDVKRLRERNQHNSQVMSFEARLNNLFDDSQRRIYIETIPPLFVQFNYFEENTNKTFAYSANRSSQFYSYQQTTLQGLAALGINFVVYVPPTVLSTNYDLIREEVGFYALAGKSWVLRATNEIIIIPNTPENNTIGNE